MRLTRSGVSPVLVIGIVAIIVVAGAGAYIVVVLPSLNKSTSSSSTSSSTSSATASSSTTTSTSTSTTSKTTTSTSTSTSSTTSTSSSSSSTSTSSSTSSASTTTCTSTTASTTGLSAFLNFTSLFTNYSDMKVHYNGTSGGNSFDLQSEYQVVAHTAKTFKVNITDTSGGNVVHYTAYVWKNGTASAVYYGGQNVTGGFASFYYLAAMAGFLVETTFAAPAFLAVVTDPTVVHLVSQSTIMIGPATVAVKNYGANTLPLMFSSCGESVDLSKFSLQTGLVSGKSDLLVTQVTLSGTVTDNGQSQNVDFSLQVTSITTT